MTFPAARKLAFIEYLGKNKSLSWIPEQISAILDSPNNILAIEYLKALSCLNSSIEPVTITREGAGYHDQTLGGLFSSASALRQGITGLVTTKMRITLLLLIIYFRNCHKTVTRFLKKTITNAFLCLQMIFSLLFKSKAFDRNKRYTDAISGYYTGDCKPDHHI